MLHNMRCLRQCELYLELRKKRWVMLLFLNVLLPPAKHNPIAGRVTVFFKTVYIRLLVVV